MSHNVFIDEDKSLAHRNLLINGNFDYWQRNSTFSTSSSTPIYTADRFAMRTGGALTANVTRQTDSEYSRYLFRMRAASSGSDIVQIGQQIEYDMFRKYLGKIMTVTVRAKAARDNLASTAQYIMAQYITGGTIDANVKFGGGSVLYTPITLTTSMANYSFSFILPSNTTSLFIQFGSGSAQSFTITVDGFDLSWIALTPGALAVDRPILAGNSIAEELVLCHRYYETNYDEGKFPGDTAVGYPGAVVLIAPGVYNLRMQVDFKVRKRAVPNVTPYAPVSGTVSNSRNLSNASDFNTWAYGIGQHSCIIVSDGEGGSTIAGNNYASYYVAECEL